MSEPRKDSQSPEQPGVHAVLAEFDHPDDLMHACEKVRDAGFTRWDAYTPFPVHGLDQAMGIRMTVLPWLVLGGGMTGCGVGFLMQWWMNAVDYPYIISGKPAFSIPASIPVAFELTILLSAFATFFGVLLMGGLPKWSHPLFLKKRFMRATADRFFIAIDHDDPKFAEARAFLSGLGGTIGDIEDCDKDTSPAALPSWMHWAGLTAALLLLCPLIYFVTVRNSFSRTPAYHVVPDMDYGEKFKPQTANAMFGDGRAMRLPVAGTVARGELREDSHLEEGKIGEDWAKTFPGSLTLDQTFMQRGALMYAVHCAPCHGLSGKGDGMVTKRAQEKRLSWVPPTNIHAPSVTEQPVGQIYGSIKHGVRNMKGYGREIETKDRWAIILYLQALQRSQNASLSDVPPEKRNQIKEGN